MGCPATTKPRLSQPQHYSRRHFHSLAVFTLAYSRRRTLHTAPYTVRGGVLRDPSPGLVCAFSTLPFLFLRKYCVFYTAFNGAPEALITE